MSTYTGKALKWEEGAELDGAADAGTGEARTGNTECPKWAVAVPQDGRSVIHGRVGGRARPPPVSLQQGRTVHAFTVPGEWTRFWKAPDLLSRTHGGMIALPGEYLQPRLPEPFYAEIADRAWVETFANGRLSRTLNVLRAEKPSGDAGPQRRGCGRGDGDADATRGGLGPPWRNAGKPSSRFMPGAIRSGWSPPLMVLSLTNKTPGQQGRDLLPCVSSVSAQRAASTSSEIDLLRAGRHTTAVPLGPCSPRRGGSDTTSGIHHSINAKISSSMPSAGPPAPRKIDVPLLPGDPPVNVDLQASSTLLRHRTLPAARPIRRSRAAAARLPVEQQEWVDKLLRTKGLLPKPGSAGMLSLADAANAGTRE